MKLARFRVPGLILAGLVLLGIGVGAGSVFTSLPGSEAPPGEGATAPAATEAVVCFGHGDVEHGIRALAPLQPGRVVDVPVHESQRVEKGDVLVRLNDRDARLRVSEAQVALEFAEKQLSEARPLPQQHKAKIQQQQAAVDAAAHRVTAARRLLDRKRGLYKANQLSAEDVAIAEESVKEAEAMGRAEAERLTELKLHDPQISVQKAEAQVRLARVRLQQAERVLEECTLMAPTAGTVQRILVGAGDLVGTDPRHPAVHFCPNEPRLVRAQVEQEFARRVWEGQRARIRDQSDPSLVWTGKVSRVADGYTQRRPLLDDPSQPSDVRTVECLVTLDPGQPTLRIGQRVRVTLGQLPD
jgi:multidrug resistance efflux pump